MTSLLVRVYVCESQGLTTAPRGPWGRETGRGRHQAYSVRGAHDLYIHTQTRSHLPHAGAPAKTEELVPWKL